MLSLTVRSLTAALAELFSKTSQEATQVEKHRLVAQKHLDITHDVSAAAGALNNRLAQYSTNLGAYIAASVGCRANHSASLAEYETHATGQIFTLLADVSALSLIITFHCTCCDEINRIQDLRSFLVLIL